MVNAVAGLMELYQHRLYRYLMRIVMQPSTAEDLFQQTWLRVMERIQKYDPKRSFEGWLFSVAHNLAIDHLRRRQPESLDEPTRAGEMRFDLARSADPGRSKNCCPWSGRSGLPKRWRSFRYPIVK